MLSNKINRILIVLLLILVFLPVKGQVSFEVKTSPNVQFNFTNITEYKAGIIVANALELQVNASNKWELHVGAITNVIDEWNNIDYYSSTGEVPEVSMMQLQFRNANSTSLLSGFNGLQDISNPLIIIGDGTIGAGADIFCPDKGTNEPGDATTTPGCYTFDVDMKIVPGISSTPYRAGLYQMTIEFKLIEDL